jgi:2-methylisocitrate lyase-like PEP mutase family enzyme
MGHTSENSGHAGSRRSIRELLQQPEILQAMGAHDGMLARIAQRAGFPALYHGSFAAAATHGLPDIGLLNLTDTAGGLERVASSVEIPVIADADTGYGDEPGVWHTVRRLERAGASAIQIEDQVFPKRCGHMEGKEVISRDAMIAKVRTACAARDPETVIIARTDSAQSHGIDEAIDRCNAYAEAGADVVFIDRPETEAELADAARRLDAPAIANMTETGRTPLLSAAELTEIGYAIVIYPSNQLWMIAGAYQALCRSIVETGSSADVRDQMMSFDDVNDLLGLSTFQALEA